MQFSLVTIITAALAATSLAAPSNAIVAKKALSLEARDGCDPIGCVDVVLASACLLAAIAVDQIEVADLCVEGGPDAICPCANCISGLPDFLHSNGFCL